MVIRKATIEDIPQMLPLWRQLMDMHAEMEPMFKAVENGEVNFGEFLKSILVNDKFEIFVADEHAKILGYVIISTSLTPDVFVIRRRLYIQDMMIHPEHKRKGIATSLMEAVLDFAKEKQIEKMDLLVAVKNKEANEFWKAMGFEPALNYMNRYLV